MQKEPTDQQPKLRVLRKRHFNGDGWDREDVLQYAVTVDAGYGESYEEWRDIPVVLEDDL